MRPLFFYLKGYLKDLSQPATLLGLAILLYSGRGLILFGLGRSIRNLPPVFYGTLGLVYLLFMIGLGLVARRNPDLRRVIGLVRGGGKLAALLATGLGGLALLVVLFGGGRLGLARSVVEWWLLLIGGLGIALAAPLIEEIIFRGLLMACLGEWLPRYLPRLKWPVHYPVIGLSALAFALVHLGSSPLFLIVLFGGGLLYGWVRWRSGSIWPSLAGHAAWNSVLIIGQLMNWL